MTSTSANFLLVATSNELKPTNVSIRIVYSRPPDALKRQLIVSTKIHSYILVGHWSLIRKCAYKSV